MPTNGFSIKPLKVKLLAGEQKATESCLVCFSDPRGIRPLSSPPMACWAAGPAE